MDIEIIARAVILRDGQILLAHTRGASNTYLPGGHVEFGEAARAALRRELWEELGREAQIGPFLGAVEHRFLAGPKEFHEINLVFALANPDDFQTAASREGQLEVFWQPVSELDGVNLQPRPLLALIRAWQEGSLQGSAWGSTIESAPAPNG